MDYKTVLTAIRQQHIASLYLLHGEEAYYLRQIEQALIDSLIPAEDREMNLIVFDGDPSREELIATIETSPFFGEKNLILVRNTKLFSAGRKTEGTAPQENSDRLTDRLQALFSNIPSYSHVVFITPDKPDKRRKLFKTLEKTGVVFEAAPLKGRELRNWLTERLGELTIKMAPDAQEHLLTAVSMMPQVSLDFLNNELTKISLYTAGKPQATSQDLLQILSAVPEVSVFAMVEALSQRQTAQALQLLQEQLAAGEHPIRLLALLARQVRQLLQTKALIRQGSTAKEVADYFKVHPFIGEKLVKQSRGFSETILKTAILNLTAADRNLKTSRGGPEALEKIIIELCA